AKRHADRGLRLAQAGDLKGAEAELRLAVHLSPNDPDYLAALAGTLGMQQTLVEAGRYFEKALKIAPGNLVVRRDLAANQCQIGQLAEACANLERILKVKPGDPPSILLLGMVNENLKNYASAAKLLESVPELLRERPESMAALARAYYRTGRKQKARQTLEDLLHKCYYKQSKFRETVEAMDQAIDMEPTRESNYLDLGRMLSDHQLLSVAREVAKKAVERVPDSFRAHMMKGLVEAKQGDYADALASYRRAVMLQPDSSEAVFSLARMQALAG